MNTEVLAWIVAVIAAPVAYLIGYRKGLNDPRIKAKQNVYDFYTKRRVK